MGGKRVVGRSRTPRGGVRGERRTRRGKKRGKITKRRLVHIFSVKTAAAESGCGGNRRGEGQDDGNLPADILCVSCRGSLPHTPYAEHSPSSTLPPVLLPSSRPLPLSFFICLLEFWVLGSIDYRQVIHEIRGRRSETTVPSRASLLARRDTNNLSQIRFSRRDNLATTRSEKKKLGQVRR